MERKLMDVERLEEIMNAFGKRAVGFLVLAATLLLLGLVLTTSCQRKRQPTAEKEPPVPATASSELQMPDAVRSGHLEGEASVPDEIPLAFAADLAGKLLTGDWNVRGEVSAVEDGKVTFLSDHQQTGHLVYRLPAGLRILLAPNRPFSLRRDAEFYAAGLSYDLVALSAGDLIVTSGRLFGPVPQRSRIWKELSIRQANQREAIIGESKYGTTYSVPVLVVVEGQTTSVEVGIVEQIRLGAETYSLLVLRSCEGVPSEEYGGVFEDAGFGLEYVVVPE
ncbi:MAG: hypothetical protein JSW03_07980 [Candidatus Eiseniibacteriota bacterium]|nr:MAG: hypothetical protein JSW03_07980 [Candidatus Eisenbacteria bacterium]